MLDTKPLLEATDFPPIRRGSFDTLQVNIGYKCNQRCLHCHVNAGPTRTEMMSTDTVAIIIELLSEGNIKTLDITGGAPELHDQFRELVSAARGLGVHVIDRCNLTVLFEPGQEGTAEFLAEMGVEVVASLPCYSVDNVDAQRGDGVFDKSIAALKMLNQLGYATTNQQLQLNLVYNPQGPNLPPSQQALEADYRRELRAHFGIEFSQLFAIANMPIKRFGSTLVSKGEFEPYMALLKKNYSADNLAGLMCRNTVSVDWQGYLYDCDFNQQLGMPALIASSGRPQLRDLLSQELAGEEIFIADHCYGCTAGQGSSCGGAL